MKRRRFIKAMGGAVVAPLGVLPAAEAGRRLHLVSLSFDDGFKKSFLRTAEIFERFSLSACFNVIASAHLPGNQVRDDYMRPEQFGDFGVWNELQDRGHEIMPHGYQHANLARLPLDEAKELVRKCLDLFSRELRGFDPRRAVFNFPYNSSTPELEAWLPTVVMAFRARGGPLNPIPSAATVKVTTGGFGPGSSEKHLDETVEKLLAQPRGWLVYNLHGLDEEGWGPISPGYLERLLGRLRGIESVRIVPTGRVLLQARAGTWARV
jgi:peptidoglycan/xylan/chitin deacetylase (PgdA/CDA1 family)